jgi:FixJ family two-component response regulator
MKNGAVDFLPKPVKDTDLLKAIEQALERSAREHAQRDEIEDIQNRINTLTPHERQVLEFIVSGAFKVAFGGEDKHPRGEIGMLREACSPYWTKVQ